MVEVLAYTITTASEAIGVHPNTIYSLVRQGKLDARKSGARTLIPTSPLRSYIDNLPKAQIGQANHSEAA